MSQYNEIGSDLLDDLSSLNGRISIPARNQMQTKTTVIGHGSNTLIASIRVTKYNNLISKVNIFNEEVIIKPSYPPLVGNQRKAKLTIPERSNVIGKIIITPRNKMTGKVEIVEPPIYTLELNPIKDAFVRSGIPTLNYGKEQSMVVGYDRSKNEAYRSLLQFDVSQIPENAKIEKVYLKLFNNRINNNTRQMGVYTSASTWDEYGVTWANQPAVKGIVAISDIGEYGYSRIDVTDIVRSWYNGTEENFGFILKAINENFSQTEQFSTRESYNNKPVLEVQYKLNIIYSFGRAEINSRMFVMAVGNSSVKARINIPQYDDSRNMRSRIHVRNFNYWMESTIAVNKPNMPSKIRVRRHDYKELAGTLRVRVKGGYLPEEQLNGKIVVNTAYKIGRIVIPYARNLNATIRVRRYQQDKRDLSGKIVINKHILKAKIKVKQHSSKDLQGHIRVRYKKSLPSTVIINKPNLLSRITVTYYKQISGRINVRQYKQLRSKIIIPYRKDLKGRINVIYASHMPARIQVLSGYLRARIVVPAHGESVKIGKIRVRVKDIKEIRGRIYIDSDNILGGYVYIL